MVLRRSHAWQPTRNNRTLIHLGIISIYPYFQLLHITVDQVPSVLICNLNQSLITLLELNSSCLPVPEFDSRPELYLALLQSARWIYRWDPMKGGVACPPMIFAVKNVKHLSACSYLLPNMKSKNSVAQSVNPRNWNNKSHLFRPSRPKKAKRH